MSREHSIKDVPRRHTSLPRDRQVGEALASTPTSASAWGPARTAGVLVGRCRRRRRRLTVAVARCGFATREGPAGRQRRRERARVSAGR
jgi:hypothetical protein